MSSPLTEPSPAATTTQPRVLAHQLSAHTGQVVRLCGWLHRVRELKSVTFVVIRDRSGLAQVILEPGELGAYGEESVLEVTGTVTRNAAAPSGVEIIQPTITVLAEAERVPFDLYRPELKATLPTILDNAPVSLRHMRVKAAFTISAAAIAGFRQTMSAESFVEISTPKIVGSATESGANVFALNYFGQRAFLAQSPQFYKQAMVGVFERVFETGPVFRAEPHDTVRHLAEYTSLDAEFGFIDDYEDVAAICTEAIRGMIKQVAVGAAAAVEILGITLPVVPAVIPRLHFTEVLRMFGEEHGEDTTGLNDLSPAHERFIGEWAKRVHGSDFVIVSGYPMSKRPFYTAEDPQRPGYSDSFDLLFRGVELVTGGRRLHRYRDYIDAITRAGETVEPYEGYLRTFRHGMPPHGGFAIGLERFVSRLIGASNIRQARLFPRDLTRLAP